jgi:hypothetical protein
LTQKFEVDTLELEGTSDSFVFGEGLRNRHEKAFIKRRRKKKKKKPRKQKTPSLLKAEAASFPLSTVAAHTPGTRLGREELRFK